MPIDDVPKNDREELRRRRLISSGRRYDKTRTYCKTCKCVTMHSCPYVRLKDALGVYCMRCVTINPPSTRSAEAREQRVQGTP